MRGLPSRLGMLTPSTSCLLSAPTVLGREAAATSGITSGLWVRRGH